MLDMEMCLDSRRTRMVKLALNAGSSKQGKAARACVASNWVDANILLGDKSSFWRGFPFSKPLHIQSNLWTINLELKLKHQCCGCLTWPLHCLWYICLYKSHENCLISWRRTPNAPNGFLSQMWSHQKRVRSVHRLQTHWFADPEDVWSPRAELWRSAGSCCEGWRLWCPALPLWGSGRLRWRSGRSSWGVPGGHSAGVSRFLAILSYPREKATHLCLCWQSLHGCQQKDHRIKLQM